MFLFVSALVYSQTWTEDAGSEWNIEYTVITKENFEKILKTNEATAESASLNYADKSELEDFKIIRGTKPKLDGRYYLSIRRIAKSENAKLAIFYFRSTIAYGNTETGLMTISFLVTSSPGSINLKNNRAEYDKRFSAFMNMVNSEQKTDETPKQAD